MDKRDLNKIASKIASEGIEISDKEFLKNIYSLDDFELLFNEFDDLISEVEYKKQDFTLIFYLGLFNLIDSSKIKLLGDITKLKSFNLLKGALYKYFLGHLKITYKSFQINFNQNYFSLIDHWNPYKFHSMRPLFSLLNWVYYYDKDLFFDLFFKDKSNFLFITLIRGGVIKNLDFVEKYIQFDCGDEIKLYAIFYYFILPYSFSHYNIGKLKSNLAIIMKIPLNFLMKIILDYIRCPYMDGIPMVLINLIKKNDILFYETFNDIKLNNIQEIKSFLFLLEYSPRSFQNNLFSIILKKLGELLTRKFIFVEKYDLKFFYEYLSKEQISEVVQLLIEIKENLVFTAELDSQLRIEKFLIDVKKYEQLTELIEFSLSF